MIRRSLGCWIMGAAVFACNVGNNSQATDDAPVARCLGSIGSLKVNSSRPPLMAISEKGTIYVFWSCHEERAVPGSGALPKIPDEFCPAAKNLDSSIVPAACVRQNGHWSKPQFLVEGIKDCDPQYLWCDDDKVHLVLAHRTKKTGAHLAYDETKKRWTRVGQLPFSDNALLKRGKTAHLVGVLDGFICYSYFEGTSWSAPIRIQEVGKGFAHARIAVSKQGTFYVVWSAGGERGHHCATISRGGVQARPLPFQVFGHEFDVAIDPAGRLVLVYLPEMPERTPNGGKLHVRYAADGKWSDASTIDVPGYLVYGGIGLVYTDERVFLTWQSMEDTEKDGGVLSRSVRRMSILDGKSWSRPRLFALSDYDDPDIDPSPIGGFSVALCLDGETNVHAVWGSGKPFYCVVARLDGKSVLPASANEPRVRRPTNVWARRPKAPPAKKGTEYASPRDTYRTYIEAVRENDLKAAKQCWVIDDDNKSGALDVIVGMWISTRQLNQTAVEKFGEEGSKAILKNWRRKDVTDAALDLTRKRLDDAEVKIKGDAAELKINWKDDDGYPNPAFEAGGSRIFRKIGGNWKIDANKMTDLKRGADFFEKGSWGPMFRDQVVIMNEAVDGMEKGRLKTAKELKEFIDAKLAAMTKKYEEERKTNPKGK